MLADFEEFQHAQVQLRLRASPQRISSKPKGVPRQRNCPTPVCIEASQRINWSPASNCQNRSHFNVSEQLGDCPGRLFALVLVSEREIESPAKHEPMPLVIGGQRPLSRKQVWVLRLLVEVRSIVNRF